MNHVLVFMTLSGSAAFLVYQMIRLVCRDKLTVEYRYILLRISLLFYLLPIPILAERIRENIRILSGNDTLFTKSWQQGETYYEDMSRILFYSKEGIVLPRYSKVFWILIICWGTFSAVMVGRNILDYHKEKKYMLACTHKIEQVHLSGKAREISKKYRVMYRVTEQRNISFTCGLFPPVVVMSSDMEPKERNFIVNHELAHIQQLDFLIRWLSLLCRIIHVFNPLVYLLYLELKQVSEQCCDSKALKGATEAERMEYGHLLIEYARNTDVKNQLIAFSQKRMIKGRIEMIKKQKTGKKIVLLTSTILLLVAGTTPVLAYTPVHLQETAEPLEAMEETDFMEFQAGKEYIPEDELNFQYADSYFLAENGEVTIIEESALEMYAACKHTYVKGTLKKHSKTKNGGCKVQTYACKKCSKCGNIKQGELLSTTNYTKCPH